MLTILLSVCLGVISVLSSTVEDRLNDANGNKTLLNHEISTEWADSPGFRGTADILWSCLVTLTACIYTAMHLNIPTKHRSKWRQIGAKIKWALTTLLAPELVLCTAVFQFRAARSLCKDLNKLREKKRKGSNASNAPRLPQEDFDLYYGYWVVMGGFVVDVSDIHDTETRVPLNPKGVEFLAKAGHFFEMSKNRIADRSKTNVLAQSLVCIQVTWMLVQCIARKSAGYLLTLLEIHTMVHVVCALLIYTFWWRVSDPLPNLRCGD